MTKRDVVRAAESVADRLGNAKAVCRKSYIHLAILEAYLDGDPIRPARNGSGMTALFSADERAVLRFLEHRERHAKIACLHVARATEPHHLIWWISPSALR